MKFSGLIYTAGNVTKVFSFNVVLKKENDDIPTGTVLHFKNYYSVGLVVFSVFYILGIDIIFFPGKYLRNIKKTGSLCKSCDIFCGASQILKVTSDVQGKD